MQKILSRAFATSILAYAVLAGPARADDTLKVAIGQINNWENQMPTLGQDAGIFKKYGLTLDNFGTAGAGETMQPIIAGSADVGIGVGVAGVMRVFSKGAPVRILLPAFTGTRADLYWYVKAGFTAEVARRRDRQEHHCVFDQRLQLQQYRGGFCRHAWGQGQAHRDRHAGGDPDGSHVRPGRHWLGRVSGGPEGG